MSMHWVSIIVFGAVLLLLLLIIINYWKLKIIKIIAYLLAIGIVLLTKNEILKASLGRIQLMNHSRIVNVILLTTFIFKSISLCTYSLTLREERGSLIKLIVIGLRWHFSYKGWSSCYILGLVIKLSHLNTYYSKASRTVIKGSDTSVAYIDLMIWGFTWMFLNFLSFHDLHLLFNYPTLFNLCHFLSILSDLPFVLIILLKK
jgi:hypothetical protein